MILQFTAAVVILITAIYLYLNQKWNKCRKDLEQRNIPYTTMPSFFSIFVLGKRLEKIQEEKVRQFGKYFGFIQMNSVNIVLSEPELIQLILSKEFTNFPNRRKFNTDDPIFANAVSVVDVDKWKRLRAIMAPTFSTGKLRRMKPCIDQISQTLIKNINDARTKSDILNMKEFAGAFTMDTIIQVLFGIKVDSLIDPNNLIIINVKKMFSTDLSLKNALIFFMIFSGGNFMRKFLRYFRLNGDVLEFFTNFSLKIIEEKRKEFKQKDFAKASTFIEFLLEAEHELDLHKDVLTKQTNGGINGVNHDDSNVKLIKYMTNEELVSQCVLFFLAGYETTATLVSLSVYFLALNPDKQKLAFEEVSQTISQLRKENPDHDKDDLDLIPYEYYQSKFEYLTGVINESLRLSPPAPFVERRVDNDFVLKTSDGKINLQVKKGEMIQIPVWALHHDKEYFPEPEQFLPERHFGENGNKFPKYAFLPFGSGPRACLAKSLVLFEAKMALVALINTFKFDKCEKTKVPLDYLNQGGFLSPRDVYLKVEQR